jgi:uncharacterized repeat protein (TIGR03803 family)
MARHFKSASSKVKSRFHDSFQEKSDGTAPYAGLVLAGSTLYGTTENGGSYRMGMVFAFNLPVLLNLALQGAQAGFSWSDPAVSLPKPRRS